MQEQMQMIDKKNLLTSFEEIGLFDPFIANNRQKTEKRIAELWVHKNVYPEKVMEDEKPPKCIFLPDRAMFRKIIKMQIKINDLY